MQDNNYKERERERNKRISFNYEKKDEREEKNYKSNFQANARKADEERSLTSLFEFLKTK